MSSNAQEATCRQMRKLIESPQGTEQFCVVARRKEYSAVAWEQPQVCTTGLQLGEGECEIEERRAETESVINQTSARSSNSQLSR